MNEKIKESISFFKLLLTFSVTVNAGCIAWLFKNLVTASVFQISISLLAIIILTFAVWFLIYLIIIFLRDLKEEI